MAKTKTDADQTIAQLRRQVAALLETVDELVVDVNSNSELCDTLRAERDAWRKRAEPVSPEYGICHYLVREGGSLSFFQPRGSAQAILADTLDLERMTAERDEWRAKYDELSADFDQLQNATKGSEYR